MSTSGALIVAPRSPMTRPRNASSNCSSSAGRTGVVVMWISCRRRSAGAVHRPWDAPPSAAGVRAPSTHRQPGPAAENAAARDGSGAPARTYARGVLRLWLCGQIAGDLDGDPLAMPSADRARALIGWLALHPGQHPRTVISGRLWPDGPQESARASLRTALWSVRQSLGPVTDEVLAASRTTLGWRPGQVWVDALADPLEHDGELLPGIDDDWADSARDERRSRLLRRLDD